MELLIPTVGSPAIAQRLLRIRRKLREVQEQARRGNLRARVPAAPTINTASIPCSTSRPSLPLRSGHNVACRRIIARFSCHVGNGGAGRIAACCRWAMEPIPSAKSSSARAAADEGSLSSLSREQSQPLQGEWTCDGAA